MEGEAAPQEEEVWPGLASARYPLALGRGGESGAAAKARRGQRRGVADLLARLAAQDLERENDQTSK